MLDVHPPHHAANTWRDFFIHIATIVIGLLIAVGLEQTVEAIHHHHQLERLDQDLRAESESNLKSIAHDLEFEKFEAWYDGAASAVLASQQGLRHATLSPVPCIPGAPADGSIRLVLPSQAVWITARENGIANLLPADQARIYFRRGTLFDILSRFVDKIFDNCPRLNAMQRRLAHRSADGTTYDWTLTPAQADEFAALATEQTATLKAMCFRLRYLRGFEQDMLDGGHRINGAPLEGTFRDMLDREDIPPSP